MTAADGVPDRPTWGDLSIVIDRPDGTQYRWSGDELDGANVPVDLAFGSAMPGGFKGLACTLLRDLRAPGAEGLYDDVTVLGPGGEIVWQGRLQQMPTSTDGGGRVQPQAVGWSSHLEDDATFREIYVDRETGSWAGRTAGRMQTLLGSLSPQDAASRWDDSNAAGSAGPVIDLTVHVAPWTTAIGRPERGTLCSAGGVPLGSVEWRWRGGRDRANWLSTTTAFSDIGGVSSIQQDVATSTAGMPDGGRWSVTFASGAVRSVEAALFYPAYPAGVADATYGVYLAEVAVYGRHSVPGVRGRSYAGTGQGPYGYRASDLLPDVLQRSAPLLRWSTGPNGSITPTDFPIPHLVFKEPTTAADVVQKLNAYHYWDWAVWENRTFYWRPRNSGRTWSIATADGLDLSLEGSTTDAVYNGVVVQYQDFAAQPHTIGPPGSIAEAIDDRLVSYDPSNPATTHGIRRWGVLALSTATDLEGAVLIGQTWLGAQATATRRGSATVYGTVTDEHGQPHPAWRIKAGDQLVVTDRPDDPPRRIIETNYNHAGRSASLTLDNSAPTLDAILERYAAAFAGQL